MLFEGKKSTVAQKGDVICIDVEGKMVSILREGKPLLKENKVPDYYLSVEDGVQIGVLAEFAAALIGCKARELKDLEIGHRDHVHFEFV